MRLIVIVKINFLNYKFLILMRIFINFSNGKYITLQVQPNDLIGSIKSMIEEREGIPLKNQELSFRGHLLIDEKDIESYSVQEDSALCLSTKSENESLNNQLMTLFVSVPNRKLSFHVKPSDTIKDVKRMVEDEVALPASDISFCYEGKTLEDNALIGENFKNESTIYYIPTKK